MSTSPTIPVLTPTIGRIVYYRGREGTIRAAIVTQVHGIFCLNLHVFGIDSSDAEAGPKTSVTHAQPEQEPSCYPSWHWMPYQLGQAAKSVEVAAAKGPTGFIELGSNVRDRVSGFTGIAISETSYLNGCVRYGVQPAIDKDGKMPDCVYLDLHQLEVLEGGVFPVVSNTGGPQRGEPSASAARSL
jgi:hypothetical protein